MFDEIRFSQWFNYDEGIVDTTFQIKLDEKEAKALIVRGFAEPISKSFPVEYAVEMNNLINIELESKEAQNEN